MHYKSFAKNIKNNCRTPLGGNFCASDDSYSFLEIGLSEPQRGSTFLKIPRRYFSRLFKL